TLGQADCDTTWSYAGGVGGTVGKIVPGDSITKSCTFTVGASGDHLSATLGAPATASYSATSASAHFDVATTYTIDRSTPATLVNGDKVTSADDGLTLTATFVVTMPYGDDTDVNLNDTQNLTAELDALTV